MSSVHSLPYIFLYSPAFPLIPCMHMHSLESPCMFQKVDACLYIPLESEMLTVCGLSVR